ncbi:hypothetical protein J437_LFUL014764, partial [Ladona fulva]
MTPNLNWFTERGIPAYKILITISASGLIFILEDPEDTKMGAGVYGPGNDDSEMMGG